MRDYQFMLLQRMRDKFHEQKEALNKLDSRFFRHQHKHIRYNESLPVIYIHLLSMQDIQDMLNMYKLAYILDSMFSTEYTFGFK